MVALEAGDGRLPETDGPGMVLIEKPDGHFHIAVVAKCADGWNLLDFPTTRRVLEPGGTIPGWTGLMLVPRTPSVEGLLSARPRQGLFARALMAAAVLFVAAAASYYLARRRTGSVLGLTLCMLLLVACRPGRVDGAEGSVLRFAPDRIDLGVLAATAVENHGLDVCARLENRSSVSFIIDRIAAGCTCTTVKDVGDSIPANGWVYFPVHWDLARRGSSSIDVSVIGHFDRDGEGSTAATLVVDVAVLGDLRLDPPQVLLSESDASERQVDLYHFLISGEQPVVVDNVSAPDWVLVEPLGRKVREGSQGFQSIVVLSYRLSLREGAQFDDEESSVVFKASVPSGVTMSLPVVLYGGTHR